VKSVCVVVAPDPSVVIPLIITSPMTCNLAVGFVEPIPRLPLEGTYPTSVSAIPIEVTPILFAKVG
jgi:hypothetical protein